MNGRRWSGAWFQERPLSARPYRCVRGDLSGRFLRHEESRAVKAPLSVSFLSTIGNTIRTISNGPGHLLEIGDAPLRGIAYQRCPALLCCCCLWTTPRLTGGDHTALRFLPFHFTKRNLFHSSIHTEFGQQ